MQDIVKALLSKLDLSSAAGREESSFEERLEPSEETERLIGSLQAEFHRDVEKSAAR